METILPPTVCLDGSAVRRIREENRLTQLYVAKVVGVTTDTISRWENNRYPSIKRENALALAEALETSVEKILQAETGECSTDDTEPKRTLFWLLTASVLLVLIFIGAYFFSGEPQSPPTGVAATRYLPNYVAPGSIVPVQVWLETDEAAQGFILRERFPKGWKLIEANPPASSLDNVEGMARWIVKSGEERRQIVYLLKVAPNSGQGREAAFSGEVVARNSGRNKPIAVRGLGELEVSTVHWADLNGDHVIDDSELLQASDRVDEMQGVHINWDHLQDIWDAGAYLWDSEEQKFIPVKHHRAQPLP